jgi:hypothetical protein
VRCCPPVTDAHHAAAQSSQSRGSSLSYAVPPNTFRGVLTCQEGRLWPAHGDVLASAGVARHPLHEPLSERRSGMAA